MIFGVVPFSTYSFGEAAQSNRVLLEMDLQFDATFAFTIYVSSTTGYATKPRDNPPNQPFRGVMQSYSFERSIMQGDIGQYSTGVGSLIISNEDAFYDFLPLDYTIDARPIYLKLGRVDGSYDDAFTLAKVTSTGWNIDTGQVSIDLVDFSYKLEVPMQQATYGGAGGVDGSTDLAGKRKPLCFGYAREVPAIDLVPNLLVRQVNDGPVQSINNVYDRGVSLSIGADYPTYAALVAATVAPGYYATCLALGLFKLGSVPAGNVTADVHGVNFGGYVETTADIVRWALNHRTSLVENVDINLNSFIALNLAQPAPINYWLGPDDSTTVAAFISNVMGGIGGWGGFDRDGRFAVRIFSAPVGLPKASFDRRDMIGGEIRREPLPSAYRPPPWRWRITYAKAWTVQTDLAGSVPADHKAFVSQEFRLAEAKNPIVLIDHPFAQDRDPVTAYFTNQADAQAEAQRRLTLFRTSNSIYRATFPRRMLRRDIGDEIKITHDRFDLRFGRSMIILEMRENVSFSGNSALDTVEVAAYG